MTEAPTPPRDDSAPPRPPAGEIMSRPEYLQTGALASIERAVELAVSLDHLKRERPALLTDLRLALVRSAAVRAEPADLATLHTLGLATERGTPMADVTPVALAMLRGAAGEETVENPFVEPANRALFDYVRSGTTVSMMFEPHEVKAVHENATVIDLMDAAPDASWVGYVQARGKGPTAGGGLPPDRN